VPCRCRLHTAQDSKRRHNRQVQRSAGRYASGVGGESEAGCRVVVDYTPPSFNHTGSSNRNRAVPQASRTSTLAAPPKRPVRLPPPRLVAPPSKRRRMLQAQRTQNVTLPSWEAFHRTQQQVEAKKPSSGNQGVSPLDALASVAMREAGTKKVPAANAVNVRVPIDKNFASVNRQKQEQQLVYLQEMELQKAAVAQELHEANLLAQAKQAMVAQQQAAALQAGYVNLVMDYSNVPQVQFVPQGLETLSFLPQGVEYYTPTVLAQHHVGDPRVFIGNRHFPSASLEASDSKVQPTATLNEHVASVWQKYNHANTSKMMSKHKGTEDIVGPLKKRKMGNSQPLPSRNAAGGMTQV